MSFDLINPLMLAGLAGVALPLLVHLLSRRKFDIVEWGAMQFLDPGRKTRRRIQLEHWLLMLLRMGLIALVTFALSRPWASGGLFSSYVSNQGRDVVIVIDGSLSMGYEGRATTPHAAAIQFVHDYLEVLRPGDSVAILDARDQVRSVIESPTRDFRRVRDAVDALPQPAGSSNLAAACSRAVQILSRTSNLAREVIVLTDGQSRCWSVSDEILWQRFDDLLELPAVRPNVWVVDVDGAFADQRENFSVDRLELSRDLTVPGFPTRIRTSVRRSGGRDETMRRAYLEIDGQRLKGKSWNLNLPPDGQARVDFEYRFPSAGSHLIGVVIDDDNLPGDNHAEAAVQVSEALPVLLIDGDWQADPRQRETFYARIALTPSANDTPWIRCAVIRSDDFSGNSIGDSVAIVLANVPRLSESQSGAIRDFAARGGGVCIALGDRIDADAWNEHLLGGDQPLIRTRLRQIERDRSDQSDGVRVLSSSLQLPWIERFQEQHDGGFTDARWSAWWQMDVNDAGANVDPDSAPMVPSGDDALEATAAVPTASGPIVAARLQTFDPFLVMGRYGRGTVAVLAGGIDADWSTLPARTDFVPFLHELLFHVSSGQVSRNVDAGRPLLFPVAKDADLDDYRFFGPDETNFEPEPAGDEIQPLGRLSDTAIPGAYRFGLHENAIPGSMEFAVVNYDRAESQLASLKEDERLWLAETSRLTFATDINELRQLMFGNESRTELWRWLLLIFLGMLIGEVLLTRRLVQGGHVIPSNDADGTIADNEEIG